MSLAARPFLAPVLLATLTLGACGGHDETPDVKPTALVTLATVSAGPVGDTITAYGEVAFAPQGERVLVSPVEARITEMLAPAGHTVRAGEVVALLAPTPTAQVDITKAAQDASTSEAAFQRAKRLRADGLVSDADVETARAAAAVAAKNRQIMGGRLGVIALRSPATGVVESVSAAPGDQVAAGGAVARIGSLTDVRVHLGVEPAAASRIAVGGRVHVATLAAGGPEMEARITAVDPHADPQTRLASVFVQVPGSKIAPGIPVRGSISPAVGRSAITAPRAAILYEGDQPYVFVVRGGVAHRRDVKLGADLGDRAEITGGVQAGEQLAVEGASALDDGMAVRLK